MSWRLVFYGSLCLVLRVPPISKIIFDHLERVDWARIGFQLYERIGGLCFILIRVSLISCTIFAAFLFDILV